MKLRVALMVGAACAQPALVGPTSVRLPLMSAESEGIAPTPPRRDSAVCRSQRRHFPLEAKRLSTAGSDYYPIYFV
jgi:hypothetical protein